MCTYLTKRGATYYFRRAIPVELRPALGGKSEFMLSLRTKDRETAKRLVPDKTKETDRLLDAAKAAAGAETVAPASRSSGPSAIDLERMAHESQELAAQDKRRAAREHKRREWDEILSKSTARLPPHYAAVKDILREERERAALAEERLLIARAKLAESHLPDAPPAPADAPQSAPEEVASTEGVTMLDDAIVDLWAAERRVVQKGIDTHRAVARWFYERTGRKPVDQITRKDVLAFKARLVEEGQTPANIKSKLSRLRTLLQWAFANDYAPLNAAQGVEMKDNEAAKNKRKPFDIASLNAIFSSPVYSENARPIQGRGEAAYWLPLLALFTGARLEELGQLRTIDVRLEHYPDQQGDNRSAWFIHIREDEEDGLKLKNAGSERVIPVHPKLERLGFVQFVQAAAEAKQARLFPLLKPNVYGRLTAKWGEWWSIYRRETCGITDKRLVFHSFRHTFKDYARHAGIAEGIQRQIMGHSSGDVADDYGSGYSLHQLVEGMASYKVPGLVLIL